jgi:hypothetical protein
MPTAEATLLDDACARIVIQPAPVAVGSDGVDACATLPLMNSNHDPSSGRFTRDPSLRSEKIARGLKGNWNACRNPWRSYWRRRALPASSRWALKLIADYVPQLGSDKGGESSISFAEMKVMETAAVARVCWALALAAGDLEAVARFLAAERDALKAIGLARRPRPAPDLRTYLAQRAAQGPQAAEGQDRPPDA